jgi:prepilin-type N-terminal cleavage/methylation domain-containing protein
MNRKGHEGFTLLEILIAMAIFALVLSMLYTAYTGTFRNMDETETQADIYHMARIALERIAEDLESAYIPPWAVGQETEGKTPQPAPFVGEDAQISDRSADTLLFFSRAHLVFDDEEVDTTVARISYDVRQSAVGEEVFILYRSDTPGFEEGPEQGTGGLILCDNLHAVNFTYYDDKGRGYDRWDSTNEEFKDKLPVMVSIVLEFANDRNPEAPFKFVSGVVLPMAQEMYEKAL